MCIYMYVYMYVYMYIHTHAHIKEQVGCHSFLGVSSYLLLSLLKACGSLSLPAIGNKQETDRAVMWNW